MNNSPRPSNFSTYLSNKDVFLHNHNTIIALSSIWILYYYLIHSTHSNFPNFLNNALQNVYFSCHVSLISFNLEQFPSLFWSSFTTLTFLKGPDWSFRELSPGLDLSQRFLTIRFRISVFGRSTPLPAPSLSLSLWTFPPTLLPQALPLTSPNLASASPPMPSPIPSPSCRVSGKTRHPGTRVGGAEKLACPAHSEDMRESGTLPLERLRR